MYPVRTRLVVASAISVLLVLTTWAAIALPGGSQFVYVWRVSVPVVAAILCGILALVARPHATVSRDGLIVVNLVRRTDLSWRQIVQVRFGAAAPWVLLDLSDATTLPVMAIQRSEGARALRQAQRLADLVAQASDEQ